MALPNHSEFKEFLTEYREGVLGNKSIGQVFYNYFDLHLTEISEEMDRAIWNARTSAELTTLLSGEKDPTELLRKFGWIAGYKPTWISENNGRVSYVNAESSPDESLIQSFDHVIAK
jgi:hypothetical protein